MLTDINSYIFFIFLLFSPSKSAHLNQVTGITCAQLQRLIEVINSIPDRTWTAQENTVITEQIHCSVETKNTKKSPHLKLPHHTVDIHSNYGKNGFNALLRWGKTCPSLFQTPDQGDIGTCWATSTASAMTDRICIATGGFLHFDVSPQYFVSCCHACYKPNAQYGDDPGAALKAWEHWIHEGVVSTSFYGLDEAVTHRSAVLYEKKGSFDFECKETAARIRNNSLRAKSLRYIPDLSHVQVIEEEVRKYGPITVHFDIFLDFTLYKDGIYQYTDVPGNTLIGGHFVKLLGWGTTTSGIEYWILVNSWGTDVWSSTNGFFYVKKQPTIKRVLGKNRGFVSSLWQEPELSRGQVVDRLVTDAILNSAGATLEVILKLDKSIVNREIAFSGLSPYQLAVKEENLAVMKILRNFGANVNQVTRRGSVSSIGLRTRNLKVIGELMTQGVRRMTRKEHRVFSTCFLMSFMHRKDTFLTDIIRKEDFDYDWKDKTGKNIVHYAAIAGNIDILTYLLQIKGIDVWTRDVHRKQAIDYAKNLQSSGCVELLEKAMQNNVLKNVVHRLWF